MDELGTSTYKRDGPKRGKLIKRILIGDDSPLVRSTLRTFLEAQPDIVVVGEAASGKETVEKAQELSPDLVVIDLAMSEMNGIQATRQLKALFPFTPVLLFTLVESDRLTDIAIAAGVATVISKADPALLMNRIRALFPHPESSPGIESHLENP